MITMPSEVDGHRDSLATFGDRYLRKVFTANEVDDCGAR